MDDYSAEVCYYEKLALCCLDTSNPYKMIRYYERSFQNQTEEHDSIVRNGARIQIERKKKNITNAKTKATMNQNLLDSLGLT